MTGDMYTVFVRSLKLCGVGPELSGNSSIASLPQSMDVRFLGGQTGGTRLRDKM